VVVGRAGVGTFASRGAATAKALSNDEGTPREARAGAGGGRGSAEVVVVKDGTRRSSPELGTSRSHSKQRNE